MSQTNNYKFNIPSLYAHRTLIVSYERNYLCTTWNINRTAIISINKEKEEWNIQKFGLSSVEFSEEDLLPVLPLLCSYSSSYFYVSAMTQPGEVSTSIHKISRTKRIWRNKTTDRFKNFKRFQRRYMCVQE